MRLISLLLGASLIAVAAPATAQTVEPGEAPVSNAAPVTTLRDALLQAYRTNPELAGERATLRANDENVPIARSAGLPGLSSTGGFNENLYDSSASGVGPDRQASVGLDLSVPVFSGGSVRNSVRAAERRVEAGRAGLRSVEAGVNTQVVTAYVDVILAEAIVRLNQQNVRALGVNLQATRDRFEVGDLTRTDVAQSEARLALAQGQLETAQSRLTSARETFIEVVGAPPGELAPPPPLPNLPADVTTAVNAALQNNPALQAAQRSRDATQYDVAVARAARLPRVSVGVGTDYYTYLGSVGGAAAGAGFRNDGISTSAGLQLSLPLFQGGRPAAQVRQAQARRTAAIEQVTQTERQVISTARSAFANYRSSLQVIESSRVAVEASRLGLEGVRAENSVGTRTILDVLNQEQEFLSTRVQYVTAERDAYVSGFTLLAITGGAEARSLGLGDVTLYDPVTNYDRVRKRWTDWGTDPAPVGTGTRTISTPAQTPAVTAVDDPLLQRPVDMRPANP